MKVGPFNFRLPLAVNEESAQRLIDALQQKTLPAFAERHAVTLAHLEFPNGADPSTTPLKVAMEEGALDQVIDALKFSKEKLTLETFTAHIQDGFGEETLLTVAAEHGHWDQVVEALKLSGEKLTLAPLMAQRTFGSPAECALRYGRFTELAKALKDSGEKLTLAPFLVRHPFYHTFEEAVHCGTLGQLVAALNADGVRVAPEHFLAMGSHNETLLQKLVEHHDLYDVFMPSNWVGQVGEMEKLWQWVPKDHREEIDYEAMRAKAILLSVQAVQKVSPADFEQARRVNLCAEDAMPQTQERA